jgi:hypothetical protein
MTANCASQNSDNCPLENSDQSSTSFARQLRALGQALEKFGFAAFDLEIRNGTCLVTVKTVPAERKSLSISRFLNNCLRRISLRPALTETDRHSDLCFSPEEIEEFDLRGKSRRQDSSKTPDPYSTSQLLRGAGCYLDNRNVASNVAVSVAGRWVTVRYQTHEGRLVQAQHDVEYFYDYWVKMYLRRGNRVKLAAPSAPTVIVTWRGIQNA